MLVKELIALLQKTPETYSVVLNIPVDENHPLLIDLYAEDFEIDDEFEMVELDGTITEEAEGQICEMLDNKKLKSGDVLFLTRDEPMPMKKTNADRIKALGLILHTNNTLARR